MAWIGALASFAGNALGGMLANNQLGSGIKDIKDLAAFNPQNAGGPFGAFGFTDGGGFFTEDPTSAAIRAALGGSVPGLLGGGLFNNADLQDALANADITGAFGGAQGALGQQIGSSAFGNLGALQSGLLGAGFGALGQAGDQSALIQQNLDASRALAQPFEDRLLNRTQNQLFAQGRLGTTGGAQQFGETIGTIQRGDQQRVLNAQNLGLQQQGQLQNFGLGALQGARQTEGLGFSQMLQALQQNQSSGQQRLQNAMGLFGLGTNTFNQQFGLGLQGQSGLMNQNQFGLQGLLGLLNAEANRIGATGMHAQSLGNLHSNKGGLLGSLFGGLGDALGGLF